MRLWIKDPIAVLAEGAERRHRRRGRQDRRAGRQGAAGQREGRPHLRRFAPRRHPGPRQHPPPFLPDADPRPSGGDQQGALPLAEGALPDLGAERDARGLPPGDAAGADRAPHVGLHLRLRPPLPLPGGARGRDGHPGRGGGAGRHPHDADPRLDEPLARRTAACRPTRSSRTRTPSSPTASG